MTCKCYIGETESLGNPIIRKCEECKSVAASLEEHKQVVEAIHRALPATYYAFLPLQQRVEFMVQDWQRLTRINQELQKQLENM